MSVFDRAATGLEANIRVQTATLPASELSRLDAEIGLITVARNATDAQKLVGLVFQLIQLADIETAKQNGAGTGVDRAATVTLLLIATGLINPEIGVTVADLEAASSDG